MANITLTATETFVSSVVSESITLITSGASTFTSAVTSVIPITSTFLSTNVIEPVSSSVILITSVVTLTPTANGAPPTVVFVTSTVTPTLSSNSVFYYSPTSTVASSSTSSPLVTSTASKTGKSSGLSSGGTIAVAVVVPIVAIILIVLAALFFWKKRKAKKEAEEQRKKEIEEYGFNPNHDPTLPVVGAAYAENHSEMAEDNGYRGWGNSSSTQRKPSTHMSSGKGGPFAGAVSDSSSNPGGYGYQNTPSNATGPISELHSDNTLVASEGMAGAAGAGAVAGAAAGAIGRKHSNKGVNRGPSNASSTYTGGRPQSQSSDEAELPANPVSGGYYHEEGPYYTEALPQHGPYGDGTYGAGDQPVIRDVQARRHTRIEGAPSTYPQQGSSGIAQNF